MWRREMLSERLWVCGVGRAVSVVVLLMSFTPSVQADLLVCNPSNGSVQRLDDAGRFVADFVLPGTAGISLPSGLALGPDGHLYVSDGPNNRVLRFNGRSGDFIDVFARAPELVGPTDLHFRGNDLFVGMWNQSNFQGGVARFDATTGSFEQAFGVQFGRTHAIEFDAQGRLFASRFDAATVSVFDPLSGQLIKNIAGTSVVGRPMGLSFDADEKLVISDWAGNVRIVNPESDTFERFLITGLNNTQWHEYAADGSLIVDDHNNRRLLRYDPTSGQLLGEFSDLGYIPEKFLTVSAVPEPSVLPVLSFVCLALTVGYIWRKRRKLVRLPGPLDGTLCAASATVKMRDRHENG